MAYILLIVLNEVYVYINSNPIFAYKLFAKPSTIPFAMPVEIPSQRKTSHGAVLHHLRQPWQGFAAKGIAEGIAEGTAEGTAKDITKRLCDQ